MKSISKRDRHCYISFYTTADAFAMEFACKKAGVSGRLVPVPRKLSSGCGMAYQGRAQDKALLFQILKDHHIEWQDQMTEEPF